MNSPKTQTLSLILGIILSLFTIIGSYAQAPNGFNYQAAIRNADGTILANDQATFQFSILNNSTSGSVLYRETKTLTTTQYGLINHVIGSGTVNSGNFANINWGSGSKYLKVEVNTGGGYTTVSNARLQSLPYSLYATNAASAAVADEVEYNDVKNKPWTKSGNNLYYNSGNVGIGTSSPSDLIQIGDFSKASDNYISIKTAGGNNYKAGIKLWHFANNNGITLESSEIDNKFRIISHYGGSSSASLTIDRSNNNVFSGADFYTGATDGVINCGGGELNALINMISDNNINPSNVNGDEDLFIQDDIQVNSNGYKPGGGPWTATSDARLKKDIIPFNDGLDELMKINPVRFKYIDKMELYDKDRVFVGIIAQDIQKIAPYMIDETYMFQKVKEDENGNEIIVNQGEKYLTFDGTALPYIIINAVKEQQNTIEDLKMENAELIKRIVELEKLVLLQYQSK